MRKDLVKSSKFLSLILRHKPEAIGMTLDSEGWVDITDLLDACERSGNHITMENLLDIVEQNDKKRFLIRDGMIRANQGHSKDIDLALQSVEPPKQLYHGTAIKNWHSISQRGLNKMNRQQVHLSKDRETAIKVGMRHGKPLVLRVAAKQMYIAGYEFLLSENGVWLTDMVPAQYLEKLSGAAK